MIWVSRLTSSRPSTWPMKFGRSTSVGADGDRAVDGRRKVAAVAGEGAAQIGDQRVALPVGHREKFRRDHVERRAVRLDGAAGIGVVAAGEFDRGFDQEAAGIIADRAERIVVELAAAARRLALTVPAIAGGIGVLLAVRTAAPTAAAGGSTATAAADAGAGGGFGFGLRRDSSFGFLRVRLSES